MPGLVIEKRSFPRVNLAASGLLVYRDGMYYVRLENISLSGALVTVLEHDFPLITKGEQCSLALYPNSTGGMLRLPTRFVHFGYGMACLKFCHLDQNTKLMLRSIIAHQLPERRQLPARASAAGGKR